MKRHFMLIAVFVFILALFATAALAQPQQAADPTHAATASRDWQLIASCFGMALAAAGCGYAQSKALNGACEAVARNPGVADTIRFFILLGLAFIEFLALLTFLVVLIFVLQ